MAWDLIKNFIQVDVQVTICANFQTSLTLKSSGEPVHAGAFTARLG